MGLRMASAITITGTRIASMTTITMVSHRMTPTPSTITTAEVTHIKRMKSMITKSPQLAATAMLTIPTLSTINALTTTDQKRPRLSSMNQTSDR